MISGLVDDFCVDARNRGSVTFTMNSMCSKRKPLELSFSEPSGRSRDTHMKDESDNVAEMEEVFALLETIREAEKQIKKSRNDSSYNSEEKMKSHSSAWKPSFSMEDFYYATTPSAEKDRGQEWKDFKSPGDKKTQKQDRLSAETFDLNVEATPEPQYSTS